MSEQREKYEIQPVGDVFSLAQMQGQIKAIEEMRDSILVNGLHYGIIPGCGDKPVLLKPGAEKLAFRFRMAPRFKGEDNPRDLGNGHREYIITCELVSILTGAYLGAGVGSCSTMEAKYRYRGQSFEETGEVVPKDYWNLKKIDAKAAQTMIGGPGYVTKKIDNQWLIVRQLGERQENPDLADSFNTVLKQAKKRAMVDAVLTCTAASDCFTQDIEETVEEKKSVANGAEVKVAPQVATTNGNGSTAAKPATPAAKKTTDSTPEQKAAWKAAAQIRAFQKLDDEGNPIVNSLGYHTLDFDALGKFFKEAGLPGSVKDMSATQLATAMDLLKDYPA